MLSQALTNCMSIFIGQGAISTKTCENMIDLFKKSPSKFAGTVGINQLDAVVDLEKKSSTECTYDIHDPVLIDYCKELQTVLVDYMEKYPFCNSYGAFTIKEPVKIQFYKPNQSYSTYHTERGSCFFPNNNRHLVFMTFLNTVTDGGGTEFFHQNLVTEATQGKTLIWPADWTHTHRGVMSPTQEKYIITGWYSFYEKSQ